MILIYVTCKDEKQAKEISKKLIEKRLVACANIFPIKSLYLWKGKLNEDSEYVVLLKTLNKNFGLVQREIEKMHSYEVPCIEKIAVKANKKFENWVNKTTI